MIGLPPVLGLKNLKHSGFKALARGGRPCSARRSNAKAVRLTKVRIDGRSKPLEPTVQILSTSEARANLCRLMDQTAAYQVLATERVVRVLRLWSHDEQGPAYAPPNRIFIPKIAKASASVMALATTIGQADSSRP